MHAIDLALKDLRQVVRDRRALIFLIVMPIIFTFFFGFIFNNQAKQADNRLKIGVVNRDPKGLLTNVLVDMLNASDTVRPVLVAEKDASRMDAQILKGDLAAGLVIPQGFSAGMLNGAEPKLETVLNEETDNGQTVRRAFQTIIARVTGIATTARLSAQAYAAQSPFASDADQQAYLAESVTRAAKAWQDAPLSIKTASVAKAENPLTANPYNQFSPGMIVQFCIFGLMQAAMVLVVERKTGAMARLLTTPMTKAGLIGGHLLGLFLVFFVQQLILVVFGQLVLKVNYLAQPLATLLVMAAFSLWVASMGLLVAVLVKREDQVILFAMIAMFVFSALGGAWFSLEMVGKTFYTIGHLTPGAWTIDGFQNVIARGLGIESVLLPAGIVLAYAAAFFGISVWKFRYE